MGIAVGLIYLLLLAAVNWLGIFLSWYLGDWELKAVKRQELMLLVVGGALSVSLTLLAIYLVTTRVTFSNEWDLLVWQIAISIFGPFLLGLLTALPTKIFKESGSKRSRIVNRIGCGMFHGVWLLPLSLIGYLVIPKLDDFFEWFGYEIAKVFI